MKRYLLCASVFLVSGLQIDALPILYGTTGSGGGSSTLVQLDPTSGALVQLVGSVGYTVNGLAWDASTGTLYGTTSVNDQNYNGLITINTTTGVGTPVSADGWGTPVVALASYGGDLFAWSENSDDLVSIDKTAGTFTVVGESGISTAQQGLAFNASGELYLVNYNGQYYSLDTSTGLATSLGYVGLVAHHGDFNPDTNLYYGINATGSGPKSINILDLSAGSLSGTLPTVNALHTLAFADEAVPEAGTCMMFGVGLAIVAAARKKSSAAPKKCS